MKGKKIILNVDSLSEGLGISTKDVCDAFGDGRVAGRFAEYWAGQIYNLSVENYNQAVYDAIREDNLINLKISVRTLARSNIKFQQSKYTGSGRTCEKEDLISSLKDIDIYIVVDVLDFPEVKMLPIKTKQLLEFVERDELSCSGWSRQTFYKKLELEDIEWDAVRIGE